MSRTRLLFTSMIALFAIIPQGCTHHTSPQSVAPQGVAPPAATTTITSKKTGAQYTHVRVAENDHQFEKFAPAVPTAIAPSGDEFQGTDRKAAKTSISSGASRTFPDVASLLDSGLFISDNKMLHHKPPIPKDASSDRVAEEQRNVVVTGFLYASTKESDNDFHCIIGSDASGPTRFVNVEVSGLPSSGSARDQIKAARDQFKEFFGADLPTGGGYSKFTPPIKVRVSGSIFFDVDHKAGVVGPTGLRPKTAWEIHPVTDIEFEP